ncbi:hypothetical protein BDR05DRAFT_949050 [Suillus weaverae]|nr:hypothetical protein BDR05DRAFT_949050 [Suillus weaverae]
MASNSKHRYKYNHSTQTRKRVVRHNAQRTRFTTNPQREASNYPLVIPFLNRLSSVGIEVHKCLVYSGILRCPNGRKGHPSRAAETEYPKLITLLDILTFHDGISHVDISANPTPTKHTRPTSGSSDSIDIYCGVCGDGGSAPTWDKWCTGNEDGFDDPAIDGTVLAVVRERTKSGLDDSSTHELRARLWLLSVFFRVRLIFDPECITHFDVGGNAGDGGFTDVDDTVVERVTKRTRLRVKNK